MKKLTFLLLLLPSICFSQIPEPRPNTYINDFAGVLTANQISVLNDSIYQIEKRTSVQIAVVLVNDLPSTMSIEDYSLGIGRKWHVGNAKNGLVYVNAISARKIRLEVADNLQGDITDLSASHITNRLKPYLKNKDYFGSIQELLDGIKQKIDPIAKQQLKLAEAELEKKQEQAKDTAISVLLWILGLAITVFGTWKIFFAPGYYRRKKEKEEEAEKAYEALKESYRNNPRPRYERQSSSTPYVSPTVINNDYSPPSNDSGYSRSSNNDNSSNYGNWGSGSSDIGSSSSDSGFSGGGGGTDY